ncbi:MAG TPA: hypothetical protein PKD64_11335 [Pirellulaceae bacterium]|nr:hypothetical protein [Pirellulaceae bacterium]HMO92775.1 hypothetical protein [Pirellulaceae bacterium]HMP69357.1 hypothetical protein [Pirellulaceae bacterium]
MEYWLSLVFAATFERRRSRKKITWKTQSRWRILSTLSIPSMVFFGLNILTGYTLVGMQDVSVVARGTTAGSVYALHQGLITLIDANGIRQSFKIQQGANDPIGVDNGSLFINSPAAIRVSGKLPPSVLKPGMVIKAKLEINRQGVCSAPLDGIELIGLDAPLQIVGGAIAGDRANLQQNFEVEVTAKVLANTRNSLQVEIAKNEILSRTKLTVPLEESTIVQIFGSDLDYVKAGDVVLLCQFGELGTSDRIVTDLEIELVPRETLVPNSLDSRLQLQFVELSDVPHKSPRTDRSRNFIIHTDLSDRRLKILTTKLENMLELTSKYYRTQPRQPIECFVVQDINRWPTGKFDTEMREAILNETGITIVTQEGEQRTARIYLAAIDRRVVHEALRAFCIQTFGGVGPKWYARGMAELRDNWKADDLSVAVPPATVEYLRSAPPLSLERLVNDQPVGASDWQDASWRWAACYFLATNPNYASRFNVLGASLMSTDPRDSFRNAFAERMEQLNFEFAFYLKHLQLGLRTDLIAWKWNTKPRAISSSRSVKTKVNAKEGWQPSGLQVEKGEKYLIRASGTWQTDKELTPVDADGDIEGKGQLVGVIFSDYALSEPFELGKDVEFTVPSAGHLFLRCNDDWSELADNVGTINVDISRVK